LDLNCYHSFQYTSFFIHLLKCAYIVWAISPPHHCLFPTLSSLPHPRSFQAEPLSLILLKKRHRHNKEDKAFLLVEIRTAIEKYSYHCFRVQMCYNPSWFISNWSLHCSWFPSHIDLCLFKVSVLVPLEWGHQTLSCFGFSAYPHTSHVCSQVQLHCCVCPKSKVRIWGRTCEFWSSEPG
jgi:hypothetical protein